MAASIQLDCKSSIMTVEVKYVGAYRMLTTKFEAAKTAIAEQKP
jgi:hypothetical protein